MNQLLGIIGICILVFFAFYLNFSNPKSVTGNNIGDYAYDFEISSIVGENVKLSDFKGKAVIINFWATWCEPCKIEMPEFEKFYAEYGDEVEILAINITSREISEKAVQSFIDDHNLTFPILLDTDSVFRHYEVINLPTSIFVDKDGKIIGSHAGELTFEMLEEVKDRFQ